MWVGGCVRRGREEGRGEREQMTAQRFVSNDLCFCRNINQRRALLKESWKSRQVSKLIDLPYLVLLIDR